jgi:hypothetical protein
MAIDLALAIHKIDPAAEYRLSHAHAQTADDILEWRSASPKPSQAQLEAAWKTIEHSRKQQAGQQGATLQQLTAQVEKYVGKPAGDLKSADVGVLLGAILWKVGALDDEGKIKPFDLWASGSDENAL